MQLEFDSLTHHLFYSIPQFLDAHLTFHDELLYVFLKLLHLATLRFVKPIPLLLQLLKLLHLTLQNPKNQNLFQLHNSTTRKCEQN